MFSFDEVKNADAEVYAAMADEMGRQRSHLELIASENLVSRGVMAAMGSHLTNKYAEGYPGKRYYGGCEYVDVVEQLAIDRAKELFGCTYANVQPHSGAQANLAVFFALVKPGDTVMGMSLDAGGHLTHGSKVNISGTYFNIVSYGVNEDGYIDYDQVRKIAVENKPKLIVAGASAYARKIDFKKFCVLGFCGLLNTSSGVPSSAIIPSAIKITLSATSLANPISWVTHNIVIPSFARSFITCKTSPTNSGSRADVGSSKSMISGFMAKALAIATRCCCPPDNLFGYSSALSSSPTFLSNSKASFLAVSLSTFFTLIGDIIMFSKTVLCGKRLNL